jgi:RNA polymerase sigma-70 factor, ECF subfamily
MLALGRLTMCDVTRDEEFTFERIVEATQRCLFERACRLEHSETRAWDLVQDTFERALRHFHKFQPGTNARAWLLSIMANLFIDGCRRRTRERLSDLSTLNDLPAPIPETPPSWENIESDQVQAAMARLAPPFQNVLDLHFTRRRSYAEIAEHLGIPSSTVGTRLNRARKKMRTLLGPPITDHVGSAATTTPALAVSG